jgi:uracil-DNA glycosylase family 4
MSTKQAQLEQIAADIISGTVCPDLAKQATQLVMGSGNINSSIVFIGEAPGKKEDLEGVPFIGAAGKFLDQMLAAAQLERTDVYITNIVKYRPPNNRDPLPAEKAAFWPFLLRQLEVIDPKVVITLGRHSMDYFLPGAKIGEVHGQPHSIELNGRKTVIMPLFHPAAALYNGSLRQTLIDDFMKVPPLVSTIETLPKQL